MLSICCGALRGSFHYPYFRRVAVSVGIYDLCHSGTADCKGN